MNRIGVVIVMLCGIAGSAAAQVSPEAEVLFRQGKSLIRDGKIAEACAAFEASEGVEHSVSTVFAAACSRVRQFSRVACPIAVVTFVAPPPSAWLGGQRGSYLLVAQHR